MSDNDDIVKEFLAESHENLDRLDREVVELEKHPADREILASIFRTIHTIKGTSGFLGFSKLGAVTHVGENMLARLRDGQLTLNPERTTALLTMVDVVRQMLAEIQATGADGSADHTELVANLTRLQLAEPAAVAPVPAQTEQPKAKSEGAAKKKEGSKAAAASSGVAAESAVVPHTAAPEQQTSDDHQCSPAATKPADAHPREASRDSIRVDVSLLDQLMNLVGELVLARNQILQFTRTTEEAGLATTGQRLNLIATELQESVMKTRMQPIDSIWSRFPRTVRDVAVANGKRVRIQMEGKETELDKTLIEAIKDPMTHLVRNAVDHGIERVEVREAAGKDPEGVLTLRAYHEGGQVNIEISDDGAGLNLKKVIEKAVQKGLIGTDQAARLSDREAANLIFLAGLSTAEKVTNVSGRGVGMDVVKTNIERIGGTVDLQSAPGKGTTVKVKIPLTLAIVPALIVTSGGQRFAIPQVSLLELVGLEGKDARRKIEMIHGAPVYRLRGNLLPLVYLKQALKIGEPQGSPSGGQRVRPEAAAGCKSGRLNIAVLQADGHRFGLLVDEISDTEEIVVKPLGKHLKNTGVFAGATIMGDGKVALILDVLGLAQHAHAVAETKEHALTEKATEAAGTAGEKQTFLLFAGPGDSRMAIPLSALARLEEFKVSQVEMSGSQWVTQYRGQILPLIRLDVAMEERRVRSRAPQTPSADGAGPIQVLVLNHEGRSCGLVVERILDIIEDRADVKSAATRANVLCSAVIGDRVTELLDIPAILRGTATWPAAASKAAGVAN